MTSEVIDHATRPSEGGSRRATRLRRTETRRPHHDRDHHPDPTEPALGAVDRLIAFWNAGTPEEQQRLASATFADGVSWRVPIGHLSGVAALVDFRDRFAEYAPDYVFQARRTPEAHHDRARLQWELVRADGRFAAGTDVLEIDGDGRICAMTGFLDEAPAGFDDHHRG